ncbi:MAG TPA: TraR/DksA family transcriptional regulator [Blastocatellia bacterium]|nr:TraR/DksA family transcriptional regulator [Blastocatellia bacterium]
MALDVEKYRERLIKERDQLDRDLGSVSNGELRAPADGDHDIIEIAQNEPVIDVEAGVADLKTRRLQQIDEALRRIDEGTYGTCEKCGKAIDPRRLDAEPAALLCIDDASAEDANIATPTL